ncbi:hypothetical protein JCGZ_12716 [Jatropha curcas]|uniref:Uncharacterized protein n=1 Tax=Jatropha curcas TaxID=180498 RepID=A0A067KN29_JATCU|nr:hypothetical protein JCGZ_12716 [Jatropha curcas]
MFVCCSDLFSRALLTALFLLQVFSISGSKIRGFLLGTGVLPGTVLGVRGSGGLEASARAVFRSMVWQASAPGPARPGTHACLAMQSPGSLADSAHGRAVWHVLRRASLWKSRTSAARAGFSYTGDIQCAHGHVPWHGLGRAVLWFFRLVSPCARHGRVT